MRVVETLMVANDLKAKLSDGDFKEIHLAHLMGDARFSRDINHKKFRKMVINQMSNVLSEASMYFVKAEMTDLICFAGEKLDEEDITSREVAPTRAGFVYFEKPISVVDVRGVDLHVNMALWYFNAEDNLIVLKWNDQYRTPDKIANNIKEEANDTSNNRKAKITQEFLKTIGRWGFIGLSVQPKGSPIGKPLYEHDEETVRMYEELEGWTPIPSGNFIRALHAYWLLMGQTLIELKEEQADKKLARTMKRFELPSEVTIMQYRRVETVGGFVGESNVQWSHRWIVRGHWRWQPFKNDAGKDDRKRIWIAPFMKGPEDKPLVLTDKIYALTR